MGIPAVGLVAAFAVGCSEDFVTCDDTRTCANGTGGSAGSSQAAGEGGADGGSTSAAGGSTASGGSTSAGSAGIGGEGGAADVAPFVLSVSPADDSTDVDPELASVVIEFSEALDPATVTADSVRVLDGTLPLEGTVTYADNRVTFTPAAPRLALLASYTLRVADTVTDVEGAALDAEFTSDFTVRDGIWGPITTVQAAKNGASLGVDGEGNVLLVWRASSGCMARWYRRGSGWEASQALGGCGALAVNHRGEAIVAWVSGTIPDNAVHAAQYRNGSWQSPTNVSRSGYVGDSVGVGMSPTGEAHVIYGAAQRCTVRRTVADGGWLPGSQQLSQNLLASSPEIAFDAGGNGVAVWVDTNIMNTSQRALLTARFPAGGSQWSARSLEAFGAAGRGAPGAATAPNGGAMTLFVDGPAAGGPILWSRFNEPRWTAPNPLSGARSSTASAPGLIFDGEDFIATWTQLQGSTSRVYASRHADGAWTAVERVSGNGAAHGPRLATDARGNVIHSWFERTGNVDELVRNRHDKASGEVSTSKRTLTSPSLSPSFAQLLSSGVNGVAAEAYWDTAASGTVVDLSVSVFE